MNWFRRMMSKKLRKYRRRFPTCKIDESATIDSNCEIGDYTFVGKDVDITKTRVGRYCSIAPHCRIGQGEHDVEAVSTSSVLNANCNYENMTRRPCMIGNDVWLGNDVIVRRGVTIGDGAVIGANSFVNGDIPPFAIAVGSPARVIRLRWTYARRAAVASSRYWELPPQEARSAIERLERDAGA